MAIKLRLPNGLVVEVESAQELQTVLSVVGANGITPSIPTPSAKGPAATKGTPEPVSDRLTAFYERIRSPDQRRVLQVLAQFDDWIDDRELRSRLGIGESSSALGAYMAGLTRNATAVGLNFTKHILSKQKKWNAQRRPYFLYRLTREMRDTIREREQIQQAPLPREAGSLFRE